MKHRGGFTLLEITRADFPLIVRMASLDGCLIVDSAGAIRNAGVILNLPGAHTGASLTPVGPWEIRGLPDATPLLPSQPSDRR